MNQKNEDRGLNKRMKTNLPFRLGSLKNVNLNITHAYSKDEVFREELITCTLMIRYVTYVTYLSL